MKTKSDVDREQEDLRWEMIQRRDPLIPSPFYFGVRTTGVFCRPGCPARLPNRENVVFFENTVDAQRAGFRPCRRCRPTTGPDSPPPESEAKGTKAVLRACALIREAEEPPPLQELARAVGYSPFHFHRLFKSALGVTPKAYARMHRLNRAKDHLLGGRTVTEAIYEAGYGSSSPFYDEAATGLGMRPSEFQSGAQGQTIRAAVVSCSLGLVLIAATEKGIAAIEFADSEAELRTRLRRRFSRARIEEGDAEFLDRVETVVAFLESPDRGLSLPLDIQGTAFQRRVWEALRAIPVGATASYSEIATRIGEPTAARAVARACATNPLAVAIPCHRVVGKDGSLRGYRWGSERKRKLLDREASTP